MLGESPTNSEESPLPTMPPYGRNSHLPAVQQIEIKLVTHITAKDAAKVADSAEPAWQAYCDARLRQFEKRG